MPDFSWELLMGAGIVVLALAFAYGLWRNATRNRANDRVTEAAARELIDHPDAYSRGGREEFKRQLRP